jgi:histidinol-phosphate aminotransferase
MRPRDLSGHTPYAAGRGIEEVAREVGLDPDDLVKLSSNENPLGPSPKAIEAVREHADTVNTYPKSAHVDLQERIAAEWDVTPGQVWLGNGGDGALDYLSRALLEPGDKVLVPDPGFAYYAMSVHYHHGRVNSYPLRKAEDFAQTPANVLDAYDGERIVYLITPHSPTGSEISHEGILAVADAVDDDTFVLVDEAYGAYTDQPSAVLLMEGRDDLGVLRTFSKSYGLAGLRVGYILAPGPWADAYEYINTPFAVNELALRAALAALDDEKFVERSVETAKWSRQYMYEHLAAKTWESAGNYVLADVGDGAAVADAAQERGVIVRDCASFGLPECVRITTGTEEGTRRAVEVLNEVLATVE